MTPFSQKKLSQVYKEAKRVSFNNYSKMVFFSDLHRGNNSYADDFEHNRILYQHALKAYQKEEYVYFELGDGFELWENRNFNEIFNAYKPTLLQLQTFLKKNNLYFLYGNHDMVLKNKKRVKKLFNYYFDKISVTKKPFLKNIHFSESILLSSEEFKKSILLIHGHQADFFNYVLWKMSRFLVRFLWKPLQILGINDPTSPAKNFKELLKVEKKIERWIVNNNHQMIIAGHTHRPRFALPNEIPYFNDGSGVHPRAITAIEIVNNSIALIKWHTISKTDGTLKITKTILEGPRHLNDYLN
ncbi:MAG: metallophosphoesterase [Lutibacter sp.]